MEFLDPQKKRAHLRRIFLGYALVATALLIGAYLIVMQAYGFGVDRKTGEVVQNGLLFVDAHPEAADITLNGEIKGRTDKRFIIPEGDYSMELNRDGYRTWKRDFELEGGKVVRLIYPFLFPQNMISTDAILYGSSPSMITQSPDRKWLVLQQPGNITAFDIVDLSNSVTTPVVTLKLPLNLLKTSGANHLIEEVEWSTDNRHVLLKHTFDGGVEYIVFDRQSPELSFNINETFKNTIFSEVTLKDKKISEFYLYDATSRVLRLGQVSNAVVSDLLQGVLTYKTHGEKEILYVATSSESSEKVEVWLRQSNDTFKIRELDANQSHLLDIARFEGNWYVATGGVNEGKVYIYKNPQSFLRRVKDKSLALTPIYVLKGINPTHLSFSANTRFIALQSGSSFNVYDAENDRGYRYDTGLNIASTKKALWMDGHRLMVIADEKVHVFDYDGINLQTLVGAWGQFSPYFDRDYNNLYTLSPSVVVEGKPALVGTQIKLRAQPTN